MSPNKSKFRTLQKRRNLKKIPIVISADRYIQVVGLISYWRIASINVCTRRIASGIPTGVFGTPTDWTLSRLSQGKAESAATLETRTPDDYSIRYESTLIGADYLF